MSVHPGARPVLTAISPALPVLHSRELSSERSLPGRDYGTGQSPGISLPREGTGCFPGCQSPPWLPVGLSRKAAGPEPAGPHPSWPVLQPHLRPPSVTLSPIPSTLSTLALVEVLECPPNISSFILVDPLSPACSHGSQLHYHFLQAAFLDSSRLFLIPLFVFS